jgi:hemerythrin-like domain-containing protein
VTSLPKTLPGFDEPLEMIEACHDRIELQLCTLEGLVPYIEAHGPDEAARKAARAVMRYFDTAGEAHNRDEDEDLFPLIRAAAARDGRHEIGATLYELEREHENMDRLYSEVRARLDAIAGGQAGQPALDADLVTRFAWIYRRHMQLESDLLLPYARRVIESSQRAMLGARMAERRRDL